MKEADSLALRTAFGKFMTGVTVATAITDDGTPVGFTANSFSSVSLDPPLLLVCPAKSMSCFEVFEQCSHFHISVLAHNQLAISDTFASKTDDRFESTAWTPDLNGVPMINGAIASFACKRKQSVDAGDHIILLGQVIDFSNREEQGLGYSEGEYFNIEQEHKSLRRL